MADDKGAPKSKKGLMYDSVSPRSEEEVISFWKENKIFERSLENRKRGKQFVFFEGPPTANGRPGIHHVEARSFKDVICRYKTMRGFFVPRQGGWDTHGLPVEIGAEKQLGLTSKKDIEKYGIAEFNQKCKESVWQFKKEWEDLTDRMAFWLDLRNPYITLDSRYIESLWWVVSEIAKRGLLYEGYRVLPWCARCGTSLSSHELAMGYKNITEDSVYVKFPIRQTDGKRENRASLLAWTTTPWTLPANVALAVHPKADYVTIELEDNPKEWLILAEARLGTISEKYKIINRTKGISLGDIFYEPLYLDKKAEAAGAYRVVSAEFVSFEEGTGIVHIAPAFGAEDMEVGKKKNLPTLLTVNEEGKMITPGFSWNGKFIKDADPIITKDLKSRGFLYKIEQYAHDYPFCWRCQTPLFYYAKTSWFFKTTGVKERMISENQKIDWRPEYIKDGRFGGWLKENVDWAISRERYWGTPLPIWKCNKCGEQKVVGSLSELDLLDPCPSTLILMRHGEAEHNVKGIVNPTRVEADSKNFLTEKGKKEILKTALLLKQKYKIDAIISSPSHRAKETAKMVGEVIGLSEVEITPDLYDILVEGFEGEKEEVFQNSFTDLAERFTKKPRGAENFRELRARVVKAIMYIREKYRGKTVLAVSHGDPIWLLKAALEGKKEEEYLGVPYPEKTAEFVKIPLHNWPYNLDGELDLHKPFVDSIQLSCPKCKSNMKRISEVADVWFDSGSMPYASIHYPVENRELFKKRYPADYISEAIDQTRGWFYTLLAVSSLLGLPASYERVISLGLVLDEKGEKMSKSRGNIVDPNMLFEKYGADAVRWYFFTVNQPWDDKAFREEDVQEALRGFLLILWNSFVYWKTYARAAITKKQETSNKLKPKLVINKWVLAKWQSVLANVTDHLENYRIVEAARSLQEFVTEDLSRWYIRRIRGEMKHEKSVAAKECAAVLRAILFDVTRALAPFAPFISEGIYKGLGGKKPSVHIEDWPNLKKVSAADKKLIEEMGKARKIVTAALEARQKAGIKIRQPLSKLKVKGETISKDIAELIEGEVNVKKVEFSKDIKKEIALDTVLTPELKEEGFVREFIRQVQDFRKELKLKPQDKVILSVDGSTTDEKILKKYENLIKKEITINKFEIQSKGASTKKEATVDGRKIEIGIK